MHYNAGYECGKMELGWVKLHRKLNSNDLLAYDNNALCMFVRLLTACDRRTGSYRTGRFKLAAANNMTPSTAYRTLKRLEKSGIITLKVNNKWTDITICKWDDYQEKVNNKRTTSEQQTDTKQEERREKREKEKDIGIFFERKELQEAFTEYVKMRKALKKPMTDRAKQLVVKKLETLYPNQPNMQLACLNQSIENSWQGVFVVKTDPNAMVNRQKPHVDKIPADISDADRAKARATAEKIRNNLAERMKIK